ncbi:RHS repeat domain-containing protein [Aquimarina rhabdastrellae]
MNISNLHRYLKYILSITMILLQYAVIAQINVTTTDKNWVLTNSYDVNGNLIGANVSFSDKLGKGLQTITYDKKLDEMWASETFYDKQGRPVLQTLGAPIGRLASFNYQTSFTRKQNGLRLTIGDYEEGDLENPSLIGNQFNTLGWYYSESNTREPYQDVTDRPYSRDIYSTLNPGEVLKTVGGNKQNGKWRQVYSFTMPIGQELSSAVAFGDNKYNNQKVVKTVTRDVDNIETVVFRDSDGNVIAAARSGNEENASLESRINIVRIESQAWVDVHIPVGGCDNIRLYEKAIDIKSTAIESKLEGVKNNLIDQVTIEGEDINVLTENVNSENKDLEITLEEIPLGYFYRIYDLITEEVIDNTKARSAYILKPGFYRIESRYGISTSFLGTTRYISSPVYLPGEFGIQHCENYYDYSLNEYNKSGRLVSSKQPQGKMETTYRYNALGELIETNSVDEGAAQFKYRKDGQIRYSQNSKQVEISISTEPIPTFSSEFSYTNYDDYGRPIESGVFHSNHILGNIFYSLDPDGSEPSMLGLSKKEQNFTVYDIADNTGLEAAFNGDSRSVNYERQSFVSGNVSKTYTTNPETTTTWYSYDIYGRVKWIVQKINGLEGVKTIDYKYDPITNQVAKVYYQKGASKEQFVHRYTYDSADYSLVKVETSTNDVHFVEDANYEYYETGALKRMELGDGLQGMDYIYNINGALKSINHPDLHAGVDPGGDLQDVFGMSLQYYNQDYRRTNTPKDIRHLHGGIDQYNGNIKAMSWNAQMLGTNESEDTYYYSYNKNKWLTGASFNRVISNVQGFVQDTILSTPIENTQHIQASRSIALKPGFYAKASEKLTFRANIVKGEDIDTNGDYNVYGITYDANGNIQSLNRNKHTENGNNAMDQLSYVYKTDKQNQLLRVDDGVIGDTNAADIKDQDGKNYVYNDIGQLVKNNEEGIEYSYNASGLVTEIKKNNVSLVKFFYNDRGHRVRKDSYLVPGSVSTEYYIRDAAGNTIAIYRDGLLIERTIYGSSRLGVFKGDRRYYELKDHLGNVRAVIGRTNSGQEMSLSATDYYPFGMTMPNKNIDGGYRYTYQGQEKDYETGKEAFEERIWDSRIVRWLSPDPAGKGDSPYIGMYNNPLKYIDIKGRDTLNVYRSRIIGTDSYGIDQYQLNFEIIKNGKSLKQKLVLYMYANHDYERGPGTGDNALESKGVYPIRFDQMTAHRGQNNWENTIRLNNAGVFIHPGNPSYNIGCKAVCNSPNYEFGNLYEPSFMDTVNALQQIRDLFDKTNQQGFFFITNQRFPVDPIMAPSPQGIVTNKYKVITGDLISHGVTN